MKIFINGSKWSTSRITFEAWKPYEVTDEQFEKLQKFELAIDPVKTTDEKLAFLTKTQMAEAQAVVAYKKELRKWTEKAREVLLDSIVEMDVTVQNQYTLLEKYMEKRRTLPSFELLQSNFKEIFAFLETKVEAGKLAPMPLPKQ